MMNWEGAEALAQQSGDGFFVFDEARFRSNFQALHKAFSDHYAPVKIGYSYKTNYTPYLCKIVHELGGFAEVVSVMEYRLAQKLGVPGERIIFNGPCKNKEEFEEAAASGTTLNLDSARDIALLGEFATAHPTTRATLVLRCNFALRDGEISRFGLDVGSDEFNAALAMIDAHDTLELSGLHCHFPDRDLESFGLRAHKLVALAKELFPNGAPRTLNIGGGYFSNMPEALRQSFSAPPASFEDYGKLVGDILSDAYPDENDRPTLFLEPGTAVVADTFSFFCRVLSVRSVRGRDIATVAGSMFDISPTARSRNLPASIVSQSGETGETSYDITGFTCIEGDILTEGLSGQIAADDFIRYDNVGSYSVVMRPPFILPARAVFANTPNGDHICIKRAQSVDDVFQNFEF